jgi:hypothetical protein
VQAGSTDGRYSGFKQCFKCILEREGIAGLYKGIIAKSLRNICDTSSSALMFGLARLTGTKIPDYTNAIDIETSFDTPPQPPEPPRIKFVDVNQLLQDPFEY